MSPLLLLALAGCQEPFDTDRHDLRGFRIAAVGVSDGAARAAVWSGLGPWHDAPPTLRWTLDGEALGEGFDVPVPATAAGQLLELAATSPDGDERLAQVIVQDTAPLPLSVARGAVDLSASDLSLSARRAASATAVETSAPSGEAQRMTLSGVPEGASARWMAAAGTVLELEDDVADLLAEEVLFDDGEIESREEVGDGLYPGLTLVLGGEGDSDWLWVDAAVGVEDATLLRHRGRLLPADAAVPAGLAAATLEADETAGVALVDVESVADLAQQDALGCAPAAGVPFELSWVAEGRCPLPDVLGARVVVEVW